MNPQEKSESPVRVCNYKWFALAAIVAGTAAVGIAMRLITMFQRMTEAKDPYVRLVEVTENTTEQLKPVLDLQRKAQWRLDFVNAENSMGFHAPQEATRVLGEPIDYSRQAQIMANALGRKTE